MRWKRSQRANNGTECTSLSGLDSEGHNGIGSHLSYQKQIDGGMQKMFGIQWP